MKPVEFTKVTKKYIKNRIDEYENIIHEDSRKLLYEKTLEEINNRKLFLKDLMAISYWLAKGFIEIAFYTKDSYFTKEFEIYKENINK